MSFRVNPLSLCVSQSTFEAWLRERGHLEILDKCGLDRALVDRHGFLASFFKALASITVEDLCKNPVPWTGEFFDCGLGPLETYSCPHSVTQAKLRMEENMKRYMGNYLILSLIILACFLYKVPVALLGLVSTFAVWDTLLVYTNSRGLSLDGYLFLCLKLICNMITMFMVIYCKVAVVLAGAGLSSTLVVMLHSSFRRITSSQNSTRGVPDPSRGR